MAKKKTATIEVFRSRNKEFCWRCMGVNGKELFRASETYKRKGSMVKIMLKYLGINGIMTGGVGYSGNFDMVDLTIKKGKA